MSELKISAEVRTNTGKGVARKLRSAGRIPGVYYHAGKDPVSLSVDNHEITTLMNNPQGLVQLELSDGNSELAIVKTYDLNPITDDIIHVDFMGVKRGEEFQTTVPIRLVGEAAGVKLGGVLEQLIYELEISVLPSNLPEAIEIDITELVVGDGVQVKDIDQKDYTILTEEDQTIIHLIEARAYEEEEEVEGEEDEVAEGEEAAEGEETAETEES